MAYCPHCGAEGVDSSGQCPSCAATVHDTAGSGPSSEPPPLPPVGDGDCLRHPGIRAVCSCSQCAELFCASCVDHPGPAALCGSCRGAAVSVRSPEIHVEDEWTNKTAGEALAMSIVGFFICGPIFEIWAVVMANRVTRHANETGRNVPGLAKAKAVKVICVAYFVFLVIYALIKAASSS